MPLPRSRQYVVSLPNEPCHADPYGRCGKTCFGNQSRFDLEATTLTSVWVTSRRCSFASTHQLSEMTAAE